MGIFSEPLAEVASYVEDLDRALRSLRKGKGLSRLQRTWIAFCVTGIIVTHTLCWERFERGSAGYYKARALSFMLHRAPIPWEKLLVASSLLLLGLYRIRSGVLTIDDTNRSRSRSTTRLFGVHKVKDKKTNGFVMAQNLVRLVLVSESITIPVGVEFYRPDPELKKWAEQDKALRKKKVPKSQRPPKPKPSKEYPNRHQIAARLLRRFKYWANEVLIRAIVADAAYLSPFFRAECARIYPGVQLISQLRCNQLVWDKRDRAKTLEQYFSSVTAQKTTILRRGSDKITFFMASARLRVKSHKGRRMLVVAIKYEDDEKFRYLCAIDLTWRSVDVAKAYAFRWLSEVEIEDWKLYEGWGKLACQQGEDGARRGVNLSLLVDHFLLQHPEQLRLARTGQPLHTVGTLMNQLQVKCLLNQIQTILESPDPKAALQEFAEQLNEAVVLRPSDKHMSGKEFPELGPSPPLVRRYAKTA